MLRAPRRQAPPYNCRQDDPRCSIVEAPEPISPPKPAPPAEYPESEPAPMPVGDGPPQSLIRKPRENVTDREKLLYRAPSMGEMESGKDEREVLTAHLDAAMAKLQSANATFNTPKEMKKGQTVVVMVVVSFDELAEEMAKKYLPSGPYEIAKILANSTMAAYLVNDDDGLSVRADHPNEVRPLLSKGTTQWEWDVHALKSGKHRLKVSIAAVLADIPGSPARTALTLSKEITVSVSPVQAVGEFVDDNWQWLWATLIMPIGALAWSRYKKAPVEPQRGGWRKGLD
jgi:hypothetical protein